MYLIFFKFIPETLIKLDYVINNYTFLLLFYAFFFRELKFDWSEAEPPIFEKFIIVESEMVNGKIFSFFFHISVKLTHWDWNANEFFTAFVSSCLLKDVEIICTIKYSGKICAKIYSSNDVHICIIETKLDLADTGLITEAVSQKYKVNDFTFFTETKLYFSDCSPAVKEQINIRRNITAHLKFQKRKSTL